MIASASSICWTGSTSQNVMELKMDSPTHNPSATESLARGPEPPLVLMTRPPDDPILRERIGAEMWTGVCLRFESALSEQDKRLWADPPPDPAKSPEYMRVMHMFDNFLLSQFSEWGWRLLMSRGALHRLSEWEIYSPAMLDRLESELALRSRVLRGEKSAPFAEDIVKFMDGDNGDNGAIAELQRLLRRQRDEFGARSRAPSCGEIAEWIKEEVKSHLEHYPLLSGNLAQLVSWVENLPAKNRDAAQTLRRGDMRAPGLFYSWYAACSNRSEKHVRDTMSALRRARR
jgi:hypothetical protein